MAEREAGPMVGGLREDDSQLCTQMRGVRESESTARTTFWRGNYESNPGLREEFLNIARSRGNGQVS